MTSAAPVQVPIQAVPVGVYPVYAMTEPFTAVEEASTVAGAPVAATVTRVGVTFESSHDNVEA